MGVSKTLAVCPPVAGQPWVSLSLGAQLSVGPRHHRAQRVGTVGGHEIHRLGAILRDEAREGIREGERAQAVGETLLQDLKARLHPRLEWVDAQQACAETVERGNERRLRVACRVSLVQLQQARPDTLSQLPRGALGESDREDPPRRDTIDADGPHKALHQHRGLAAARTRGEQQRALTALCRLLLLVCERALAHRSHLQIVG